MSYEDPGWRPLLRMLVPFVGLFHLSRRKRVDGLTALRALFLAFVIGVWLFLYVLSFVIADGVGSDGVSRTLYPWGLSTFGIVALVSVGWVRSRPLNVASGESLAASYRNHFLLGMALSESVALAGFVGAFLTDRLWTYVVGLAFTMVGFLMIAPTRSDIERRQQQITAQGSPLSLGEELMRPPPPGRR